MSNSSREQRKSNSRTSNDKKYYKNAKLKNHEDKIKHRFKQYDNVEFRRCMNNCERSDRKNIFEKACRKICMSKLN